MSFVCWCSIRQLRRTVGDQTDDNDDLRRQLDRSQRAEDELLDELELSRQELSRLQIDLQLKTVSLGRAYFHSPPWYATGCNICAALHRLKTISFKGLVMNLSSNDEDYYSVLNPSPFVVQETVPQQWTLHYWIYTTSRNLMS